MEDASSESSSSIALPTVASILGIKGALRFRRHGASQKAHVVLRRVDVSDDSSYIDGKPTVAYFSLFAQKRIEVKPGKEILLAVASEDSTFTDQAVIFTGDLSTPDSNSEEEEEVEKQIVQDDAVPDSPSNHIVPPKMRRTWNKQVEQVSPEPDTVVPSLPSYVSVAVQAEPTCESHTKPPAAAEEALVKPEDPALEPLPMSHEDAPISGEPSRSLSPMSIGSPPSTPAQSPLISRAMSLVQIPSTPATGLPISLVGNSLPITRNEVEAKEREPAVHTDDASRTSQVSPVSSETVDMDLQSSPSSSGVDDDEIPGLITGSVSRRPGPSTVPPRKPFPLVLPSPSFRPQFVPAAPPPLSITSHTARMPSADEPTEPKSATPALSVTASSRRSLPIRNPFVSGGFMTEFVGGRESLTTQKVPPPKDSGDSEKSSPSTPSVFSRESPTTGYGTNNPPVSASQPSSRYVSPHTSRASEVLLPVISNQSHAVAQPQPQTRPMPNPPPLPRLSDTTLPYSGKASTWSNYPPPTGNDRSLEYNPIESLSKSMNIPPPPRFAPPPPPQQPPPPPPPTYQNHLVRPPSPYQSIVSRQPVIDAKYIPDDRYISPTYRDGEPTHPGMNLFIIPPHNEPRRPESPYPHRQVSPRERSYVLISPPGLSNTMRHSSSSPPGFLHGSSGSKPSPTRLPVRMRYDPNPQQVQYESWEWSSPVATGYALVNDTQRSIHIQAPRPMAPPSSASAVLQYRQRTNSACSTPSDDSKGKKRALDGGAELESTRPRKRSYPWPVYEPLYSTRIRSDDDVAIRQIAFSSDAERFAVICNDRTIRIWNTLHRTEIARLAQNAPVLAVAWMTDDVGVVSLGQDGLISKWTRNNQNHWQWAKLLDAGKEDSICFAYQRDRIAVAFPRLGVKVWIWIKGTWQPQRSILRQNVTSIKFVEDGEALIGGTSDGVLWYCQVPNGTLRAYAFLKSKVLHLDVNASGTHALVSQSGGRAHLVGIQQMDHKGKIEQVYATNGDLGVENKQTAGAVFAHGSRLVLFGMMDNNLLVWDKAKGEILCGYDHEGEQAHAVSSIDNGAIVHTITGTKEGLLSWWKPPPMD
ncbi:hypothetical protein ID866_6780 [Astraeus odoratus]|nr:hypothetical protein ID866_6780 [Astraeus odoratus]